MVWNLIRINDKCQFCKNSIVFLGHIISSEGIRVDPSKTDAITKISVRQSLLELQRFLGMVNYLGKFISNLAEVTAPLRALSKKDVAFNLQKPQLDAIEKLKTLITSAPILKIFDLNLPTRLKIDTSSEGVRVLLEQNHVSLKNLNWHPTGYSSCAFRYYEKQYIQIEKETLSIDFGKESFHEYLYGHTFTIINDHQPLKSNFSRSIVTCLPRIPKFFLRLHKYGFQLEYVAGKEMLVSDALNRSYLFTWVWRKYFNLICKFHHFKFTH